MKSIIMQIQSPKDPRTCNVPIAIANTMQIKEKSYNSKKYGGGNTCLIDVEISLLSLLIIKQY